MGRKFILMIKGDLDGAIYTGSGSGRWDILPGEAILSAMGGKLTGARGHVYEYSGKKEDAINKHGVLYMNCPATHDLITSTMQQQHPEAK